MKPTIEEIIKGVKTMALVIPFFPNDQAAHRAIAMQLANFVSTDEQLDWLVSTACGRIRDWSRSGGVPEIRGIFCTRFPPADGIEGTVMTTAGLTPNDLENRQVYLNQERIKRRDAAQVKAEAKPDKKRLN